MSAPSWIGKKLGGRYEIQDLLGQGGMSSVYRAEDPNLRRTVAVKIIHPHLSSDSNFVSRFEEEAASVAQLRHSNIIQVYDFSSDDDTYYMVLEFVPGETLEEQLNRLDSSGRQMSIEDAIKYTANICDALEYAHSRGLIHRDVKPANIMLNLHGEAILMDFGIAKIVGGKQHTATGAVVGTALYMAPEVIKGEQVDRRVDIYSLGVTLFEILSGRPPFQAESAMSVLMMHVNDPVPDLKNLNENVPDDLVEVVKKALAKDQQDRFQTAAEFSEALRGIDLSQPEKTTSAATAIEEMPNSVVETTIEEPSVASSMAGTLVEEPMLVSNKTTAEEKQSSASQSPAGPKGRISQPNTTSKSSGRVEIFGIPLPMLIGGGIVGIIILVGAIVFGPRAFGTASIPPTETLTPTQIPSTSTPTMQEPSATTAPTNTPEPTLTPTPTDPPGPYVRINSIGIEDGIYIVEYETFGYTEVLPGEHIHFYFNNIAPEDAGVGGSGPWYLWGGPRPFDGYTVNDRPTDATQMCALQANANHTINLNTGNCVDLP